MTYEKINKDDIFGVLISCDLDFMSPINCISLVNIAHIKKTSRYQVKKYMDLLVKEGLAELKMEIIYGEDNVFPYHGYQLTSKARETDEYRLRKEKNNQIVHECFDI